MIMVHKTGICYQLKQPPFSLSVAYLFRNIHDQNANISQSQTVNISQSHSLKQSSFSPLAQVTNICVQNHLLIRLLKTWRQCDCMHVLYTKTRWERIHGTVQWFCVQVLKPLTTCSLTAPHFCSLQETLKVGVTHFKNSLSVSTFLKHFFLFIQMDILLQSDTIWRINNQKNTATTTTKSEVQEIQNLFSCWLIFTHQQKIARIMRKT